MMTDPNTLTHDLLMLTPKDWIIFYIACALGFLWFLLFMVRRFPLLLRDLIWLFREAFKADPQVNVVNLDERRRQLDAAAGRKAS